MVDVAKLLTDMYLQHRFLSLIFLLIGYSRHSSALLDLLCYNDGQSPSQYLPKSEDCLSLASHLMSHPYAHETVVLSDRPVPHPYVALPFQYNYRSCYLNILIDGEPGYDLCTWYDIGMVVNDTVTNCLLHIPSGGRGWGGETATGNNDWLLAVVTGIILAPQTEFDMLNTTGESGPHIHNDSSLESGRRVKANLLID